MGEVYKARQEDAQRDVALKLLAVERITDANDNERFLREFRILSQLTHPNIMVFYGMSITDPGIPYAVCEFIDGKTLRTVLNTEGKLSWQRSIRIAVQICSAMQAAHEQGIVHRDLKPDNVMLLETPQPDFVKLIDFGLSRTISETCSTSQKLTFTGALIGTVHYMSPEQSSGQPVDGRSDIYSLACLLFEMLSAEKLFDAETPIGTLHQQVNQEPKERLKVLKKLLVPEPLIEVLQKSLQKAPEQRQQTMLEFRNDLTELMSDETSHQQSTKRPAVSIELAMLTLAILLFLSAGIFVATRKTLDTPGVAENDNQRSAHLSEAIKSSTKRTPVDRSHLLVPRDGERVEEEIGKLRKAGKEADAEALGLAWLEKYADSRNVSYTATAGILVQLLSMMHVDASGKIEKSTALVRRGEFVLSKLSASDPQSQVRKFQLVNQLERYYRSSMTPEAQLKSEAALRSLFEHLSRLGTDSPVWADVMGTAERMYSSGQYARVEYLLERHLNYVESHDKDELESPRFIEFRMLHGKNQTILGFPGKAIKSFKEAHRLILMFLKTKAENQSTETKLGLGDVQYDEALYFQEKHLDREKLKQYLCDLTEYLSSLSCSDCKEYFADCLQYSNFANPEQSRTSLALMGQIAYKARAYKEAVQFAQRLKSESLKDAKVSPAYSNIDDLRLLFYQSSSAIESGQERSAFEQFYKECRRLERECDSNKAKGKFFASSGCFEMHLSLLCQDPDLVSKFRADALQFGRSAMQTATVSERDASFYANEIQLYEILNDGKPSNESRELLEEVCNKLPSNRELMTCLLFYWTEGEGEKGNQILEKSRSCWSTQASFVEARAQLYIQTIDFLIFLRRYSEALKVCKQATRTLSESSALPLMLLTARCNCLLRAK